jgi:hypothetical protein
LQYVALFLVDDDLSDEDISDLLEEIIHVRQGGI